MELGPEAKYYLQEVIDRIYRLLEQEPERTRNIVLMRLDGYSFYEIGTKFGISESSVRVIDFGTKEKLRKILKRRVSLMNEISCNVCMDLIPLVQDQIASEDSREAVEQHIKNCESCAACYSGTIPPAADTESLMVDVRRKVQFFFIMLLMFGIFFGLGLTASSELFYNSLIMPIVGVFGYVIFRWKSLYAVPLLLLFTNVISFVLNIFRGIEELGMYFRVMWTGIYSIFVVVGIVIAGLIHYVFRKE